MSGDERSREDLEQELLDERSMRVAAERRAAQLSDNVATWRRRAEERKARIDRLDQRRQVGLPRWLRRGGTGVDPPTLRAPPSPLSSLVAPAGIRATRVAALVTAPGLRAGLAAMDVHPLTDLSSVDDADIVVVEPSAFYASNDRDGLSRLLARSPGPPVAVWGADDTLTETLRATQITLPPSFDPSLNSPAANWLVNELPLVADRSRVTDPDAALLNHAAGGGYVVEGETVFSDPHDRSQASTVARRWAYREHAPWVRGRQVLEAVGVGAYEPLPAVAAVLVSNRPQLLSGALRSFSRQTYEQLSLVVGLHGAGDPDLVAELADEFGIAVIRILEFPETVSLGAALNGCIEYTTAGIVAKIDDDDHYGPAYIEDAVHALMYSGAGIVGKAMHFAYIGEQDITVLRRPGTEETLIGGIPPGASLVLRRSVWDATRFPHRARQVDVHFIRGARLAGADVYAASRWEFRVFRGSKNHTWAADPATLLSQAEPAFPGDHPELTEASGWPIVNAR